MVAMTRHHEWANSPLGIAYHEGFEESLQSQHPEDARMPDGFLVYLQKMILEKADPTYMSVEVADLVDVARETWEPEPVRLQDAFTSNGFILFPRALMLPDSDEYGEDVVLPLRAMSWIAVVDPEDPDRGCFWINYYTHIDDDLTYRTWASVSDQVNAKRTPEHIAFMRRTAPLTIAHSFQWSFGSRPWEQAPLALTGSEESARERGLEQIKLAQVIWRIAAQFVRAPRRAPRQIRRDARRHGLELEDVTVITLRRLREGQDPNEREEGGALSVQFLVRGHWHTYHYKDGPRQKWVMPYVKGPEGAPFKQTTRVFEFTR